MSILQCNPSLFHKAYNNWSEEFFRPQPVEENIEFQVEDGDLGVVENYALNMGNLDVRMIFGLGKSVRKVLQLDATSNDPDKFQLEIAYVARLQAMMSFVPNNQEQLIREKLVISEPSCILISPKIFFAFDFVKMKDDLRVRYKDFNDLVRKMDSLGQSKN